MIIYTVSEYFYISIFLKSICPTGPDFFLIESIRNTTWVSLWCRRLLVTLAVTLIVLSGAFEH